MHLAVVHYHYRPGGVRRVIETALPAFIASERLRIDGVTLVSGEKPDLLWLGQLERAIAPTKLSVFTDASLGYYAELKNRRRKTVGKRIHAALERLLQNIPTGRLVIWAHNMGLGRNTILSLELQRLSARRNTSLVLHHHDWWFDNRWGRWAAARDEGFTLMDMAKAVFPLAPARVQHVTINTSDASHFDEEEGSPAAWMPNPLGERPSLAEPECEKVRRWLCEKTGHCGPFWLLPSRLLRRKNVAEALLLTRWLRPSAALVTTAGASSADETNYARRLGTASLKHAWPLHLGVLSQNPGKCPSVGSLIAASEAIMLCSLQEGFGLPLLEAAAWKKPLIARRLNNVFPDLSKLGFEFPQVYDELWIDTALFDERAELERQKGMFSGWKMELPPAYRKLAGKKDWRRWERGRCLMPFSRLSLEGQLETLSNRADTSWALCAPFNPLLRQWRILASKGLLRHTPWRASATERLCAEVYAERFASILRKKTGAVSSAKAALRIQDGFVAERLRPENQYPLLWSRCE